MLLQRVMLDGMENPYERLERLGIEWKWKTNPSCMDFTAFMMY